MFTGKVNGVRLLQDGNVTVTLTCAGDNLQSIANSRAGEVTIYANGEAPVTDSRINVLTNLHSVAVQIAEAIDRELSKEMEIEQLTMVKEVGDIDDKYGGWDVDERGRK